MNNSETKLSDYDAIAGTVQHYIDGARSGKGDDQRVRGYLLDTDEIWGVQRGRAPLPVLPRKDEGVPQI